MSEPDAAPTRLAADPRVSPTARVRSSGPVQTLGDRPHEHILYLVPAMHDLRIADADTW